MKHAKLDTTIGQITVVASERGVCGILWQGELPEDRGLPSVEGSSPVLDRAVSQLREYFSGRRRQFDLPLDFQGTAFQKQVWQALLTIPFGETRSYGQVATQVGRPKASRAVGAANGRNPIPIIAPCHRVIGASGRLTGFGGGLDVKARLLRLEGIASPGWQDDLMHVPRVTGDRLTQAGDPPIPPKG